MLKKIPAALVLLFVFFVQGVQAAPFLDVSQDHDYFFAIEYARSEGIVDGYSDGRFGPDLTINRAEFTKIIVQAVINDEEIDGENCFNDVRGEWFAKYVCTAESRGIINGYPDGLFRPDRLVSFVEAAKIIALAFEFPFDSDEVWYRPFVRSLEYRSAIPPSIAHFEHDLTRGEMAEIIWRIRERVLDRPALSYDELQLAHSFVFGLEVDEDFIPDGAVRMDPSHPSSSDALALNDPGLFPPYERPSLEEMIGDPLPLVSPEDRSPTIDPSLIISAPPAPVLIGPDDSGIDVPVFELAPEGGPPPPPFEPTFTVQQALQYGVIVSKPSPSVFIFTDEEVYRELRVEVDRLVSDISADLGAEVRVHHKDFASPLDIRAIIKTGYESSGLIGSILIGDIPSFLNDYRLPWEQRDPNEKFYSDWFYEELSDRCPLTAEGGFVYDEETSSACRVSDADTYRDVFVGRITPPVMGSGRIAMIREYLNKNHDYRVGRSSFPRKMLLFPAVTIEHMVEQRTQDRPEYMTEETWEQLTMTPEKMETNLVYNLNKLKDGYTRDEVDFVNAESNREARDEYLEKLSKNRYETMVLSIHGSVTSQAVGNAYITVDDIKQAKPSAFFVDLTSCSVGAFNQSDYLAGWFLFSGDTLVVTAMSAVGFGPAILANSDWVEPQLFGLKGLLYGDLAGEKIRRDGSLHIIQTFGDPTLRMRRVEEGPKIAAPNRIDIGAVVAGNAYGHTPTVFPLWIKNSGAEYLKVWQHVFRGVTADTVNTAVQKQRFYPNYFVTNEHWAFDRLDFKEAYLRVVDWPHEPLTSPISDFLEPAVIAPGETVVVNVTVAAPYDYGSRTTLKGSYRDILPLITNDPNNPYYDVEITYIAEDPSLEEAFPSVTAYRDVHARHPYASSISYVSTASIMIGDDEERFDYNDFFGSERPKELWRKHERENRFRPNAGVMRGELLEALLWARGKVNHQLSCKSNYFVDAQEHSGISCYAVEQWKYDGNYSDGTLRPYEEVRFEEVGPLLAKAFYYPGEIVVNDGLDTQPLGGFFEQGMPEITDSDLIGQLVDNNAIPPTVGSLKDTVTRGELAEMLYRLKARVVDKESVRFEELQDD
jgi:hypothetical protein